MRRGVWILLLCLLPVVARALNCSVCGREIHGQYLRAEGKILCSAECWEKLLPRCSLCDAPLSGRYVKFETGGKEHLYCMKCAELPHCFSCDLPTRGVRLPDGRTLCPECAATAVRDPAKAEELYRLVELGRCRYERRSRSDTGETVSEKCTVRILDSLPEAQFIEVAAHEAAHDWLNHHTEHVPAQWNEGFAEYVASLVNGRHGNASRNLRMEENPDSVYGGGFRAVRDFARRYGLPALLEKLRGEW